MRRTDIQTALFSGNVQMFKDLAENLVGCSERHRCLCTDGAMEGQAVTEAIVNVSKIHTFRLS